MLKIPQNWPAAKLVPVTIILLVLPYFLAQDVPGSSYTFSAPALQEAIFFQGTFVSFNGEELLEVKIWVLRVLTVSQWTVLGNKI